MLRVRGDKTLSEPRRVGTNVPQGRALSPLLFNLAMADLPRCLQVSLAYPVDVAIYAHSGALWTWGPTKVGRRIRASLQAALMQHLANHVASKGLRLS